MPASECRQQRQAFAIHVQQEVPVAPVQRGLNGAYRAAITLVDVIAGFRAPHEGFQLIWRERFNQTVVITVATLYSCVVHGG